MSENVCMLLSVSYDGSVGSAILKFYEISTGKLRIVKDPTGHKPYLLTDLSPRELVERYPEVFKHRGFDHIEVVEKYDTLHDRKVLMTKVVARDPLSVGGSPHSLRDILRGHAWEARIKYHSCYLYDTRLIPGMLYRVDGGRIEPVEVEVPERVLERMAEIYGHDRDLMDEVREWIKLLQTPIPSLRRIAMDIEVGSPSETVPSPSEAKYEVIAVSLMGSDGLRKVLVLDKGAEKGDKVLSTSSGAEVEYIKDEKELIKRALHEVLRYPIVLTFNGDHFDLPYLRKRAEVLGMMDVANLISINKNESSAGFHTSIHVDLYKFFNNKSMQVYAFSNRYREVKTLDEISMALIGEGKVSLEKPIAELSYEELAEYCFQDSYLTLKLTQFDDELVMKLIVLFMRISKMTMDDLTRHNISAWIRSMMYFEHRRLNYLIPNPEDIISIKGRTATRAIIKGKKYMGAIVIDPIPGVFFNVVVVDFASLYPSMIKRWNLSYETVRCPHPECRSNKVPGTPHWVCRKRRGLSAKLVGFLRDMRVYLYKPLSKAERDEVRRRHYKVIQQALKVFINASYGVFGADTFPLYCPPMAECTTALGRYAIAKTLKKTSELGLAALYGDTDSLFIWNPPRERIKELMEWVDNNLHIDLDIDKEYRWVAFSGRKKNYLGVLTDGVVDVKGLVGKKRNTPEFIKSLFNDILMLLANASDISGLENAINSIKSRTQDAYDRLKKGLYSLDELAFRVALTKPLDMYVKNTPQHVKAARQLAKRGVRIEVGDIISFVKVRGGEGVKAVQLARIDEVDFDKYTEHIRTALEQILEALNISFEEIIGGKLMDRFL